MSRDKLMRILLVFFFLLFTFSFSTQAKLLTVILSLPTSLDINDYSTNGKQPSGYIINGIVFFGGSWGFEGGVGFERFSQNIETANNVEGKMDYRIFDITYKMSLPYIKVILGYGVGAAHLTYDIERIYEEMDRELTAEPEEIAGMKKLSTLFGIMMVNFQEDVTIFEGPIDAMFMQNTLGLASVGRSTEELDEIPTVRYMFDNDDPGKKKMLEKLRRGKRVFMWSKFIEENNMNIYKKKIKDLNDLVMVSWECKSNCLSKVNDYFTDSRLDAYYL